MRTDEIEGYDLEYFQPREQESKKLKANLPAMSDAKDHASKQVRRLTLDDNAPKLRILCPGGTIYEKTFRQGGNPFWTRRV